MLWHLWLIYHFYDARIAWTTVKVASQHEHPTYVSSKEKVRPNSTHWHNVGWWLLTSFQSYVNHLRLFHQDVLLHLKGNGKLESVHVIQKLLNGDPRRESYPGDKFIYRRQAFSELGCHKSHLIRKNYNSTIIHPSLLSSNFLRFNTA